MDEFLFSWEIWRCGVLAHCLSIRESTRVASIFPVRSPLWLGVCWFSVAESAGNFYYFALSLLSTGKPTWCQREVSFNTHRTADPDSALIKIYHPKPAREDVFVILWYSRAAIGSASQHTSVSCKCFCEVKCWLQRPWKTFYNQRRWQTKPSNLKNF